MNDGKTPQTDFRLSDPAQFARNMAVQQLAQDPFGLAVADLEVERVDARRVNPDEDVMSACLRIRYIAGAHGVGGHAERRGLDIAEDRRRPRARANPTEERMGIVFVWMGQTAPVPLDEVQPAARPRLMASATGPDHPRSQKVPLGL